MTKPTYANTSHYTPDAVLHGPLTDKLSDLNEAIAELKQTVRSHEKTIKGMKTKLSYLEEMQDNIVGQNEVVLRGQGYLEADYDEVKDLMRQESTNVWTELASLRARLEAVAETPGRAVVNQVTAMAGTQGGGAVEGDDADDEEEDDEEGEDGAKGPKMIGLVESTRVHRLARMVMENAMKMRYRQHKLPEPLPHGQAWAPAGEDDDEEQAEGPTLHPQWTSNWGINAETWVDDICHAIKQSNETYIQISQKEMDSLNLDDLRRVLETVWKNWRRKYMKSLLDADAIAKAASDTRIQGRKNQKQKERAPLRPMVRCAKDKNMGWSILLRYMSPDRSQPPSDTEGPPPSAQSPREEQQSPIPGRQPAIDLQTEEDEPADPGAHAPQGRKNKGKAPLRPDVSDEVELEPWFRCHPKWRIAPLRKYYEAFDKPVADARKLKSKKSRQRFNPYRRAGSVEVALPTCPRGGHKVPRCLVDPKWLQNHPEQEQWTADVPVSEFTEFFDVYGWPSHVARPDEIPLDPELQQVSGLASGSGPASGSQSLPRPRPRTRQIPDTNLSFDSQSEVQD